MPAPMTVPEAFQKLLERIEPHPVDVAMVQPRQVEVRDSLRRSSRFGGIVRDIVAGSFRRGTAIHPLHDVDVFLILDPKVHAPPEKQRSPHEVLSRLEQALEVEYRGRARLRPQHRSVQLRFHDIDIGFDLVPSFLHPSMAGVYWIPDLERKDWIFTNPETQHDVLKAADRTSGSKLNRLIKLIKHWNVASGKPYRSFYLEVMCYRAFSQPPPSLMMGFQQLCEHLSREVMLKCADPAGVGPRIDGGATPAVRQERQRGFQDLARRAANAIALERQKDLAGANHAWREIFKTPWPGA